MKQTILETILLTDGYKLDHRRQYPKGTEYVYATFIPRTNQWYPEAYEGSVVFGIQYFIKKYLIEEFNTHFFNLPLQDILNAYDRRIKTFLGQDAFDAIGHEHIEKLHKLGYLPIKIKALAEGTLCPLGVPVLSIINTHPDFFWLPNYLETLLSTTLWLPMTSATTARLSKKALVEHAIKTGFDKDNLGFLCHDFSMRGMAGVESAVMSGMAHLTSWNGSETLPAIAALEEYYYADAEQELLAATVPATEHSVMEAGSKESELDTYKRLLTQVYPKGFVSIVSDTWDYWNVVTTYLPKLKDIIMSRDGRFVIRPDSGDPVDIICGVDPKDCINLGDQNIYYVKGYSKMSGIDQEITYNKLRRDESFKNKCIITETEFKGTYEILWDIFGGTINEKGYKILDTHIGMIYGDAIILERQKEIYRRLENKGFAATNIVLGYGSYSYIGKVSRDSLSWAVKSSWCQINGEGKVIFKEPKTASWKKSLKGLCRVLYKDGKYVVEDQITQEEENTGFLQTVFENGNMTTAIRLQDIRENVNQSIKNALNNENA
jgi:nicotinamide phosphoribosyltransferase